MVYAEQQQSGRSWCMLAFFALIAVGFVWYEHRGFKLPQMLSGSSAPQKEDVLSNAEKKTYNKVPMSLNTYHAVNDRSVPQNTHDMCNEFDADVCQKGDRIGLCIYDAQTRKCKLTAPTLDNPMML